MNDFSQFIIILSLMVPICSVALWTSWQFIDLVRVLFNWWVLGK